MSTTARRSPVRIACLALALVCAVAAAADAQNAASGDKVRVIARVSGKFVSPAGTKPEGFDVEILRRFAAWHRVKHGRQPQLELSYAATVPALLEAIQKADADIGVGGVTATAERAKLVDFSKPILPVRSVLIAPPGVLQAGAWRDKVKGLRIGATIGSTNAAEVDRLAASMQGIKVNNSFTTNEAVFAALGGSSRQLDAAIVDLPQYWTLGKAQGLVMVDNIGTPMSMAIVLRKGSPWKAALDEFLEEFTHSGDYFKLIRAYFGSDAEQMVKGSR